MKNQESAKLKESAESAASLARVNGPSPVSPASACSTCNRQFRVKNWSILDSLSRKLLVIIKTPFIYLFTFNVCLFVCLLAIFLEK